MNCIGPRDGRLLICPNCLEQYIACHWEIRCHRHGNNQSVKIGRPCSKCRTYLSEDNVHHIGHMVKGEIFFYTSEGSGNALHTSKYKDTSYHNVAGIRIAVFDRLTHKKEKSDIKLCNNKADCFVNGDTVWGHEGGTLCLHVGEKKVDGKPVTICSGTEEK